MAGRHPWRGAAESEGQALRRVEGRRSLHNSLWNTITCFNRRGGGKNQYDVKKREIAARVADEFEYSLTPVPWKLDDE